MHVTKRTQDARKEEQGEDDEGVEGTDNSGQNTRCGLCRKRAKRKRKGV